MNTNGAGLYVLTPTNSANLHGCDDGVCVYVCSRMHERVCAYVRDEFVIYDNNNM